MFKKQKPCNYCVLCGCILKIKPNIEIIEVEMNSVNKPKGLACYPFCKRNLCT